MSHPVLSHEEEPSRTCDVCGKVFASRRGMTRHRWEHWKQPETCPWCSKEFKNERSMKIHQFYCKSKNRPVTGAIVLWTGGSRVVPTGNRLETVVSAMSHEEASRRTCDICGKIFASRRGMTRHRWEHGRPWCLIEFKNGRNVRIHRCTIDDESYNS